MVLGATFEARLPNARTGDYPIDPKVYRVVREVAGGHVHLRDVETERVRHVRIGHIRFD